MKARYRLLLTTSLQGSGEHLMNLFSYLLPHTRVPGAPQNSEALVGSPAGDCNVPLPFKLCSATGTHKYVVACAC